MNLPCVNLSLYLSFYQIYPMTEAFNYLMFFFLLISSYNQSIYHVSICHSINVPICRSIQSIQVLLLAMTEAFNNFMFLYSF